MPQRHRVTEVNNRLDVIARLCGYARRLYNILEKNSIDSRCLCAELNVASLGRNIMWQNSCFYTVP